MLKLVGVMGSGRGITKPAEKLAYDVGRAIAEKGWVLVNGGHGCGVMDASAKGAHDAGGLVVGVLPSADLDGVSEHVDIPIRTGMGDGRNYVNALSSDVVIALDGGAGTLSEVCFALIAGRTVVTLGLVCPASFDEYRDKGLLLEAESAEEAIAIVERELNR